MAWKGTRGSTEAPSTPPPTPSTRQTFASFLSTAPNVTAVDCALLSSRDPDSCTTAKQTVLAILRAGRVWPDASVRDITLRCVHEIGAPLGDEFFLADGGNDAKIIKVYSTFDAKSRCLLGARPTEPLSPNDSAVFQFLVALGQQFPQVHLLLQQTTTPFDPSDPVAYAAAVWRASAPPALRAKTDAMQQLVSTNSGSYSSAAADLQRALLCSRSACLSTGDIAIVRFLHILGHSNLPPAAVAAATQIAEQVLAENPGGVSIAMGSQTLSKMDKSVDNLVRNLTPTTGDSQGIAELLAAVKTTQSNTKSPRRLQPAPQGTTVCAICEHPGHTASQHRPSTTKHRSGRQLNDLDRLRTGAIVSTGSSQFPEAPTIAAVATEPTAPHLTAQLEALEPLLRAFVEIKGSDSYSVRRGKEAVLDSGAGIHVTPPLQPPIGDPAGCGPPITVQSFDGTTTTVSPATPVHFFPGEDPLPTHISESAPHALISLGQLLSDNWSFYGSKDSCVLLSPSGVKHSVTIRGGVLWIPIQSTPVLSTVGPLQYNIAGSAISATALPATLHQICLHRGRQAMLAAAKSQEICPGIPLKYWYPPNPCLACDVAKQPRPRTRAQESDTAGRVLRLLRRALRRDNDSTPQHTDPIQQMLQEPRPALPNYDSQSLRPCEALAIDYVYIKRGGGLPTLTCLYVYDVCTTAWHIERLAAKRDARTALRKLCILWRVFDRPYQCHIRCDTEPAIIEQSQLAIADSSNCILDTAPPYEPNCNPAEQSWRHAKDSARAILLDSGLGDQYMYAALRHAAVHHFWLPAPSRGNKSPKDTFQSSHAPLQIPPTVLVPFGVAAFPKRGPQSARNTRYPISTIKADVGVVIGYNTSVGGPITVLVPDRPTRPSVIHRRRPKLDLSRFPATEPGFFEISTRQGNAPPPESYASDDEYDADGVTLTGHSEPDIRANPYYALYPQESDTAGDSSSSENDTQSSDEDGYDTDFLIDNVTTVSNRSDSTYVPTIIVSAVKQLERNTSDLPWKSYIANPDTHEEVLNALHKEIQSLESKTLKCVTEDDPEFATAKRTATPGRFLLAQKRSGKYKARGVVRGDLQNKSLLDGEDFNYYTAASQATSVRSLIFSGHGRHKNTSTRVIGTVDVETAFLQTFAFPEGSTPRYVWFRMPDTGRRQYYRQRTPLYGECSAPKRWARTLAQHLQHCGFTQGDNDTTVWYNCKLDVSLIVHTDDILFEGEKSGVDTFLTELGHLISLGPPEFVTTNNSVDFLGFIIGKDNTQIFISIQPYVTNAIHTLTKLGLDVPESNPSTPLPSPVDNTTPQLSPHKQKLFRTAVGALGWITGARCDVLHAFSRLSQHLSSPTESALAAIQTVYAYLRNNPNWCLAQKLTVKPEWQAYTDSDYGGNTEPQNRSRAQLGCVLTCGGAPVLFTSKVSKVAFAHPQLTHAHADTSVAASEIYALGNGVNDILGVSYVVEELGLPPIPLPIHVRVDNTTAVAFANQSVKRSKLRHIDCRQEWVHALRQSDIINVSHISTRENLADFFTKPLSKSPFQSFRSQLMSQISLQPSHP